MKGIFVIIDGMGDKPCKELYGKTPLEAAKKPNLDAISEKSQLGFMYPWSKEYAPESSAALLSIFGNNPFASTRGRLEAIGAGLELVKGDLALRANFATIDKKKRIIDARVGRTLTTKEAATLAAEINNIKLNCKFLFKPTIQHRGVLVLKGNFSDNITNTDPFYPIHKFMDDQLKESVPLDEEKLSDYTSDIINDFVEKSYKVLKEHSINKARIKRGLLPANIIITRDAGIGLPKVKKFRRWASIVSMPLEIGICKASGMKVFPFSYPELKNYDVYQNLFQALEETCKFAIKVINEEARNFNFFYIHLKETDVPGHDNKPVEKKKMLELLDEIFFGFLHELIEKNKIRVLITADHSTPCSLKSHSADPVPVLFCNGKNRDGLKFSEKEVRKGSLGQIYGNELLKKAGFE